MNAKTVKELSEWYRRTHRKLPWRQSHDPYRIWISEIMLQQTQVATVLPYYERFLAELPTLAALATVDLPKLLSLWAGLGYYSRARNLQKGAQFLLQVHHGVFPTDASALREIPGIGPYTAGAIASIAFNQKAALVDGNVQRVFARYYAFQDILETPAAQKWFWQRAQENVEKSDAPRVFNQALMELGALVCTKGAPDCGQCPLRQSCAGYKQGLQSELPRRKPRRKTKPLYWIPLLIERAPHSSADPHPQLLLKYNREPGWWQNLWDFPRLEATSQAALRKLQKSVPGDSLGMCTHTVTHHKIQAFPHRVKESWARKHLPTLEGEWCTHKKLSTRPLSSLSKKILAAYDAHPVLK